MSKEPHPFVQLARGAITTYLTTGQHLKPPADLLERGQHRAGVFVSLKRKGQLRGCVGTAVPCKANLLEELISNAIAAAARDPRFPPLTQGELADLEISVDILTPPEAVSCLGELDPKRYGVMVSCEGRSGLLLPDLEGISDVKEQLRIALHKAGIGEEEAIDIKRFEVQRYR